MKAATPLIFLLFLPAVSAMGLGVAPQEIVAENSHFSIRIFNPGSEAAEVKLALADNAGWLPSELSTIPPRNALLLYPELKPNKGGIFYDNLIIETKSGNLAASLSVPITINAQKANPGVGLVIILSILIVGGFSVAVAQRFKNQTFFSRFKR